jgi:hypothetical protein
LNHVPQIIEVGQAEDHGAGEQRGARSRAQLDGGIPEMIAVMKARACMIKTSAVIYELGMKSAKKESPGTSHWTASAIADASRGPHFPTYDSTGSTMPATSCGRETTFIDFQS